MSIVDADALDLLSQASQSMTGDAKARIDAVLNEVLASGLDISKNPYDFFYTPEDTGAVVVSCLDRSRRVKTILEPSAGAGSLVDHAARLYPEAEITCIETNPINAHALQAKGYTPIQADFLEWQTDQKFDLVLANPPFRSKNDPLAFATHIEKMMKFVAKGGQLLAIAPNSLVFRDDKRIKTLREAILGNGVIEKLPPDSFKESGTAVGVVVAWWGNGGSTEPDLTYLRSLLPTKDDDEELESPDVILARIVADTREALRHLNAMQKMMKRWANEDGDDNDTPIQQTLF